MRTNRLLPVLSALAASLFLAGCLVTPVSQSGGPGSVTVAQTTPDAIIAAAVAIFPNYGYSPSSTDYPNSTSFEKPAGGFANAAWGGFNAKTFIRVKVVIIPAGNDTYVLRPQVYAVRDGGMEGFTDKQRLSVLWSSEFRPILEQVKARAGNSVGMGPNQ